MRLLIIAALLAGAADLGQPATGTLRVSVTLLDAGKPTPVARHALLISEEPPGAAPRRLLTRADGTFEVTLRPGSYVIESDQAVAFGGVAYVWRAEIAIAAGKPASLALTQENAEVVPLSSLPSSPGAPPADDASFLLARWQDSVAAVWTDTKRASGFLADARGLVVTSQRAIGNATTGEVQFTPTLKVMGQVIAADVVRNVAVLRVNPAAIKDSKTLTLDCGQAAAAAPADGDELFAIGSPLRGPKNLSTGKVERVARRVVADLRIDQASTGGPVFSAAGTLAGITSTTDDPSDPAGDARIVDTTAVCEVLKTAGATLESAAPPGAARLPVEPQQPFADAAIDEAAKRRTSDAIPYQVSSADFDISFITPVLVRAAERRWQQSAGRRTVADGKARLPEGAQERMRLLTQFGHWDEYFENFPPVLLVRVTPKLEEGFWTKVARGAASTQGVALPPMPRLGSGFGRLRVLCGNDEVTPIHGLRLVHELNEKTTTHEGLYVFDPAALSPQCGTIRLLLSSEKEPDKFDTRQLDPKIVQLFWDDFALYRAAAPQ